MVFVIKNVILKDMSSIKETVIKLFYHSNLNVLTLFLVIQFVTVFVIMKTFISTMGTVWMQKYAILSMKMSSNVPQIVIDQWLVMENVRNHAKLRNVYLIWMIVMIKDSVLMVACPIGLEMEYVIRFALQKIVNEMGAIVINLQTLQKMEKN